MEELPTDDMKWPWYWRRYNAEEDWVRFFIADVPGTILTWWLRDGYEVTISQPGYFQIRNEHNVIYEFTLEPRGE